MPTHQEAFGQKLIGKVIKRVLHDVPIGGTIPANTLLILDDGTALAFCGVTPPQHLTKTEIGKAASCLRAEQVRLVAASDQLAVVARQLETI